MRRSARVPGRRHRCGRRPGFLGWVTGGRKWWSTMNGLQQPSSTADEQPCSSLRQPAASPAASPVVSPVASPVVSIVVPVFNGEQTVERALRSVLAQTWPGLEVIVIDDCSKDRSAAIVAALDDPRVQLIRLAANGGGARARNLGVA